MNISKDGKTLYFSDEEIDTEANGEKKIFVTKRINGEETHTKVDKTKKQKHLRENIDESEKFNFDNEIVIGVSKKEDEEKKKYKKYNKNIKKIKNKKRGINKKVITIASVIILIIINIIFALTTPIFNITDIEVEGNNKVSSQTIISLSELSKNENIFRFNGKLVEEKIKENQYIEIAQIKRILPGTIKILVKEREIKYQIKLINSYAYIDKKGYILENSSIKQEVPIIVGFNITEDKLLSEKRLGEADLEKLNSVLKIISSSEKIEINSLITEVNVENNDDFILYLESENKQIHIGDTTNLTNKMLYIQKILENEKGKSGVVMINGDISSGFKPYFREE